MQTDTPVQASAKREGKARRNPRGVYEKFPGSGQWWICYVDSSGRYRREKAGSKSAAMSLVDKRRTEALQGKKLPETLRRAVVSFPEIARDALEYSKAHKVPAAARADGWHMDTILGWFRERAAADVLPQDIERRLSELGEEEELKPATLNRYRALLSLTYSIAMRNGKVSLNPARLVRLRQENNARVRFLSAEEEKALRSKIRETYSDGEAEFDLALHTGLRRGEQYRLRWQDVNLKTGILTIPRSKHGEKRHVPINSTARAALGVLRKRRTGPGYVCPGVEEERERDWRRWFEEAVPLAGVDNFRWHDLRHTFASRLVMAGVDLRTVQELLGHKTITMTVRYSHLAPRHLQEAVERLTVKPIDTPTDTGRFSVPRRANAGIAQVHGKIGAGGGSRTHTPLSGHEILSLARLPVPPLQRQI
jgi:integrase